MMEPTDPHVYADWMRKQLLAEIQRWSTDECVSVLCYMTGWDPVTVAPAFFAAAAEIDRRRQRPSSVLDFGA